MFLLKCVMNMVSSGQAHLHCCHFLSFTMASQPSVSSETWVCQREDCDILITDIDNIVDDFLQKINGVTEKHG